MPAENELPVKVASERSNLSISYLIRLIHAGKIKGKRFGPMWLIDAASLDAYLSQEHKRGPKGKKFQQEADSITDVAA